MSLTGLSRGGILSIMDSNVVLHTILEKINKLSRESSAKTQYQ